MTNILGMRKTDGKSRQSNWQENETFCIKLRKRNYKRMNEVWHFNKTMMGRQNKEYTYKYKQLIYRVFFYLTYLLSINLS